MSHSCLPLEERRNPLATPPKRKRKLPTELTPSKENSLFSFPYSKDLVPDALIDFTELWKAVSMAKLVDADKASNKGTAAYDDVLYRLGIDVVYTAIALYNLEDIFLEGEPYSTVQ